LKFYFISSKNCKEKIFFNDFLMSFYGKSAFVIIDIILSMVYFEKKKLLLPWIYRISHLGLLGL